MYIFNRVTVTPQLPKEIGRIEEMANNLWWSWNTEFLKLFQEIDLDLWERIEKNPVKFLRLVDQEKVEKAAKDESFRKKYQTVVSNFDGYMNSKDTWFAKNYPNNKNDLIAYYSAEYGLDEILPIYSGGLGILSGDHLKSASDLGLPFVAVGLLYKNGYFNQKINSYGEQCSEYKNIDLYNLPILPVKNEDGSDYMVEVDLAGTPCYLKVWQINVGRIKLYLMDSDIEKNSPEFREITLRLYGGEKEMRIRQEVILGMGGTKLLRGLGLNPTVYHMNEGHSSFLTLELIHNIMEERQVSFEMAKEIATSKTVFTTHTPVPAGNDIFDIGLVERYFHSFWPKLGITREDFLKLGMKGGNALENGFNMGILALRIAGKKNGVSKLHGEVSRELFADVWPNIAPDESPITYVTNGIHTCTWLAPNLKNLYNEYLIPYWQERIHEDIVWKKIDNIPDGELWDAHLQRKAKLMRLVKENVTRRYLNAGMSYDQINEVVGALNPNALTIGFARRFATYKRATLIFKDMARLTQILNDEKRPVQIIFAGKAHPADREGQELIKYIHEISLKPQFKGKIFLLENFNIAISRYLISGVDVWLNNPRRPMEASGTSGEKASANGVVNFSVLDCWWAEGYDGTNGWAIGTNATYDSYEAQDKADSSSIYHILENKIIPAYYNKDSKGLSKEWVKYMKNSIKTTAGKYSTSRMLVDYVNQLYMPLANLTNKSFATLEQVSDYCKWKKEMRLNWDKIKITQQPVVDNLNYDAGAKLTVNCEVQLPNIDENSVEVQVYFGQMLDNGVVKNEAVVPMKKVGVNEETKALCYEATLDLKNGGNFGYTFRVMPKHEMLIESENLDLVKWMMK